MMPQLDPAFFPTQIFWLAVSFILLYIIMARFALPQIAEVLDRRHTRIEGDLESARNAQAEAEQVEREYQQVLEKAHREAQKTIEEQKQKMAAHIAERQKKFSADIAKKTLIAEEKISKVRNEIMSELPVISAELIVTSFGKFSEQTVSKDTLVKRIMKEAA